MSFTYSTWRLTRHVSPRGRERSRTERLTSQINLRSYFGERRPARNNRTRARDSGGVCGPSPARPPSPPSSSWLPGCTSLPFFFFDIAYSFLRPDVGPGNTPAESSVDWCPRVWRGNAKIFISQKYEEQTNRRTNVLVGALFLKIHNGSTGTIEVSFSWLTRKDEDFQHSRTRKNASGLRAIE